MELYCNVSSPMTRWFVSCGLLTTPFVLIDVGVQGGISPRWSALQDHLVVYGFDLLEEVVSDLICAGDSRCRYFAIGLTDYDGEVDISVPANRYEAQLNAFAEGERRRIPVRRLDTLFREGALTTADFIKLDCEGYEPLVLRGASDYLTASNLIGADTESNFNLSPVIPNTHFCECSAALVRQRLMVFDFEFNRVPVGNSPALSSDSVHRPAVLNVLFARNLVQERESPTSYIHRAAELPVDTQTILKCAIAFEAYGLREWACHLLMSFAGQIGAKLDIDKAVHHLRPESSGSAMLSVPRHSGAQSKLLTLMAKAKRLLRG